MSVPSFRSLRPACFVLGAGLLAYAGCSSSGSSGVSVTHPTLLEVSPAQFLGKVPCAADGPGLQTYVATLYDMDELASGGAPSDVAAVEERLENETVASAFERLRGPVPSDSFELPSSAPAPCYASVGFGYVVPGRRYEVLIEGYAQAREDVQPRALGSHLLVAAEDPTGPVLKSTFRSYCRRAIPVNATVVVVDQCGDEDGTGGPSGEGGANGGSPTASLRVPVGALLGSFACTGEMGQVEKLKVTVTVGAASVEQVIDCAADAEAIFDDLEPGVANVYVEALQVREPAGSGGASAGGASAGGVSAGGVNAGGASSVDSLSVLAGATCDARLVANERVDARCVRLSGQGTLRVDLVAALEELGLSCSAASVSAVAVVMGDSVLQSSSPPSCLQPFEAGFTPSGGELDFTVRATPVDGEPVDLPCKAVIAPGKLALATCKSAP